jgi:hypothetical protein
LVFTIKLVFLKVKVSTPFVTASTLLLSSDGTEILGSVERESKKLMSLIQPRKDWCPLPLEVSIARSWGGGSA